MSFCANCGAQVTDDEKFCPNCGHPNEAVSPSSASTARPVVAVTSPGGAPAVSMPISSAVTSPGNVPSKKKLSGCAIAAIAGGVALAALGVIVVIIISLAFSLSSGAVEAMEQHLAFLKKGEIEKAYEGTSAGFRSATSLEQYRAFVASYPILSDVVSSKFDDRSVENGIATIGGAITDSTGRKTAFRAQLTKEGEQWKVMAVELPDEMAVTTPEPSSGGAPPAPPAQPAQPAQPAPSAQPSVGTIVVGAGRNPDGTLVNPGQPIATGSPTISADIELINHPLGERVQVWVERDGNRTEPIDATIEGAGSGVIPYDLQLNNAPFPEGKYTLVVMLAEAKRFTREFEIR